LLDSKRLNSVPKSDSAFFEENVRTFGWWFGMGSLLTLAVLLVQGGVRDLIYGSSYSGTWEGILSMGLTIFGGGVLAGCVAVILNRLR
jgi:hypothetical protein